jgi:RHS repeat-associated protein
MQDFDASGTIRARYGYSTFGGTTAQSGDLADGFRFRFSTKHYDVETHSCYYGYRHYTPKSGCWMSRDATGEDGGLNLYAICENDTINFFDYLGNVAIQMKELGRNGGGVDVHITSESLCDFKENGKINLEFIFDVPGNFRVSKWSLKKFGDVVVDGKRKQRRK